MNSIHNLVDTEYCAQASFRFSQKRFKVLCGSKKVEVTSHIFYQSRNYSNHRFKFLLPQEKICTISNHLKGQLEPPANHEKVYVGDVFVSDKSVYDEK